MLLNHCMVYQVPARSHKTLNVRYFSISSLFIFFFFLLRKSVKKVESLESALKDSISWVSSAAGRCASWLRWSSCLSQLGKAAQTLLPSWTTALSRQTSVSPGSKFLQTKNKYRKKTKGGSELSFLIQAICVLSDFVDVSVSGTWTGPEFCFPRGVEIFGAVARGPG